MITIRSSLWTTTSRFLATLPSEISLFSIQCSQPEAALPLPFHLSNELVQLEFGFFAWLLHQKG